MAAASYGIAPAEEAARTQRVAELRELLARNQLVRGPRDEPPRPRPAPRARARAARATARSTRAPVVCAGGVRPPRGGEAPRASRCSVVASRRRQRAPRRRAAGRRGDANVSPQRSKRGGTASPTSSRSRRPMRQKRVEEALVAEPAVAQDAAAEADARRRRRSSSPCARSRARSIRSSSACSTPGTSCCSATCGATASATCKARSSSARRSSTRPSRCRIARATSRSSRALDVAFQGRVLERLETSTRTSIPACPRELAGDGAAPRAFVAAVRRRRARVRRRPLAARAGHGAARLGRRHAGGRAVRRLLFHVSLRGRADAARAPAAGLRLGREPRAEDAADVDPHVRRDAEGGLGRRGEAADVLRLHPQRERAAVALDRERAAARAPDAQHAALRPAQRRPSRSCWTSCARRSRRRSSAPASRSRCATRRPQDTAVVVDADCVAQIFINLVDNALKFSAGAPMKIVEIAARRAQRRQRAVHGARLRARRAEDRR